MQLEAVLTRNFLKAMRAKGFITHKHNDRIAHGWPDAVFIGAGRSVYIEFKRMPRNEDAWDLLTPKQLLTIQELFAATKGLAFVIGFRHDGTLTVHRGDGFRLGGFSWARHDVLSFVRATLTRGTGIP